MKNAHNRLSTYAIVGLSGIAILGWVREPERHGDGNTRDRAILQVQPAPASRATQAETTAEEFSGRAVASVAPSPAVAPVPIEPTVRYRADRQQPPQPRRRVILLPQAETRTSNRDIAAAESSRHDFPAASSEPSLEPQRSPEAEPEPSLTTRQPSLARKQRTGTQTAMILGGAAAAGAVIGGLTGGGKGAAIGAATGVAGGYVYDRMTRSRRVPANGQPDASDPDSEQDHYTSRFATPGFAR